MIDRRLELFQSEVFRLRTVPQRVERLSEVVDPVEPRIWWGRCAERAALELGHRCDALSRGLFAGARRDIDASSFAGPSFDALVSDLFETPPLLSACIIALPAVPIDPVPGPISTLVAVPAPP